MNNDVYQRLSLLFLALTLTACVTGPSYTPRPVPASYQYQGEYINVMVPNSDGWHLVSSSLAGMEFARSGVEKVDSFGAQVLMFPLAKTSNEQAFVELIKKSFKADIDANSDRFSVIESDFQYSKERGYPCVRVASVTEDKKAQTSPNHRESLLLQAKALYCRHPVRQETGFAIIYSHRGKSLYSNLNDEADDFIKGVQVPGY